MLFSDEGPSAADLYLKAPASRAANRMLADAIATIVSDLPDDRRLRVLEVGAGTGSATELKSLPLLPDGRFRIHIYRHISGLLHAKPKSRSGRRTGAPIEYKALNIEQRPRNHKDSMAHAIRPCHSRETCCMQPATLGETLAHCRGPAWRRRGRLIVAGRAESSGVPGPNLWVAGWLVAFLGCLQTGPCPGDTGGVEAGPVGLGILQSRVHRAGCG